jgi:hypothetical protein
MLVMGCLNGRAQTLLINEFQARNAFTVTDDHGDYDDWVEIANTSDHEINLTGYYLTDDIAKPAKFRLLSAGTDLIVPAHGYLLLWADDEESQGNNHLNFKISDDEGIIALFSPMLQLVDSVEYSRQQMDISMGRLPTGSFSWKYYQRPTPGKSNSTEAYIGVAGRPEIRPASGIYNTNVAITISPFHPEDTVYYTFKSTPPAESSSFYKGPFNINGTRVINAIGTKSGYINSPEVSELYIARPAFTLPVFAILTDSLDLFGPEGIYPNYNSQLEKYCQIRYLSNSTIAAGAGAGIRIQGASSTFMPKKSFRLFFRSSYGNKLFNYPVFGAQSSGAFNKLVLKSGYDDDLTTEKGTLLRDALALELWKKCGGLPQSSRWVILYLNNRYWGIYNLRESIDEDFIRANTGMTDFDLIRFRNEGPDPVFGTIEKWDQLYDKAVHTDLSDPANFQTLTEMLDMDDFINLMAFVQFTGYYSWPWGISMYCENRASATWKTSIWDADRAFTDLSWNGFREALDVTGDYYWANHIPANLMNNAEFRQRYANRIQKLVRTVFRPENAVAVLDSLYAIVAPEIDGELERWAPGNNVWEENVNIIRDYLRRRPAMVSVMMQDYLPHATGTIDYSTNLTRTMAYPNPFSDRVHVMFCPGKKVKVDVSVYDPQGRLVRTLYSGVTAGDVEQYDWDGKTFNGSRVPPGMYLIQLKTPDELLRIKVLVK